LTNIKLICTGGKASILGGILSCFATSLFKQMLFLATMDILGLMKGGQINFNVI
jgi:hypothetical protein